MQLWDSIDFWMVASYFVVCIIVGIYQKKSIKSIREYALGGSRISGGLVSVGLFTAGLGLEYTVLQIECGMIFGCFLVLQPVTWLVMSKFFATEKLRELKRAGCMSISGIMLHLYGKPGLWISNFCTMILMLFCIGIQIIALGQVFQIFFNIPEHQGVLIGLSVIVVYSVLGGMRAILVADAFKALILGIVLPGICFISYYDVGGIVGVNSLPHSDFLFPALSKSQIFKILAVVLLLITSTTWMQVQMFLALENEEQLRKSFRACFISFIPVSIFLIMIAIIVKAKVPDAEASRGLYLLIDENFSSGMRGFAIVGLLAAIMSSIDGLLNAASVMVAHDIFKNLNSSISDRQEVFLARAALILIAATSMFLTLGYKEHIWEAHIILSSLWVGILYVPLVQGFTHRISNSIIFLVTAFAGCIGTVYFLDVTEYSGVAGVICATIACFLASAISDLIYHKSSILESLRYLPRLIWTYFIIYVKLIITGEIYPHSKSRSGEEYYYIGMFGVIYYLLASMVIADAGGQLTDILLVLRISALFLCLILSIRGILMPGVQKVVVMPIVWHFSITYCFAFLPFYSALISGMAQTWVLNLMLSVILLYRVAGGKGCIVSGIAGFFVAWKLFTMERYSIPFHQIDSFSNLLLIVYTVQVLGILYILQHQSARFTSLMQAKVLYGKAVVYELRQPLTVVGLVTDVYQGIFIANSSPDTIQPQDYKKMQDFSADLSKACNRSNLNVSILVSAMSESLDRVTDTRGYSITETLWSAISAYVSNRNQRERIKVISEQDFQFYGSFFLVRQVIANVLGNFLRNTEKSSAILVWCDKDRNLHFKDGQHNPSDTYKSTFSECVLKKNAHIDISEAWFAFAVRVMTSFGGSIKCVAMEEGDSREFILNFPLMVAALIKKRQRRMRYKP